MRDDRRQIGRWGEEIAAQTLREAGLTIIEQNWRCSAGEIDFVASERAPDYASGDPQAIWLVIVEVRTRRGYAYGGARQAFPPAKQRQLRRIAQEYVQRHEWAGPWRIDVVAIQMNLQGQTEQVEHIRHAVSGE